MKLFLILFLLLCSQLSNGQTPLIDSLESEVKRNQINGADTILTLIPPDPHYPIASTIPGLGEVTPLQLAYIIFKRENKAYSREILFYLKLPDSVPYSIAISNIVTVNNDSVFLFLHKSLNEIKNEDTYPFIYQFKDSVKGLVHYEFLTEHPRSDYVITVYTPNDEFTKIVNETSLSRSIYNGKLVNLNYQSNIQTKLSVLFQMLGRLIKVEDGLYKFNE
jgi:hypothetical protein